MQVQINNQQTVTLRTFQLKDSYTLSNYLFGLSDASKQRFAPHPFDKESIISLYSNPSTHLGFIALDENENFIGYAVVRVGYLTHDAHRFTSYGLTLSSLSDCTFAPSVADAWQSTGVGSVLMKYTNQEMVKLGIRRIFLWGGVQVSNLKAVKFYEKHGFIKLGLFEYNGSNWDMMLETKASV